MDELKRWLIAQKRICEEQEKAIEVTGVYTRMEKEKLITERFAYQVVIDKIRESETSKRKEPTFCGTCGKKTKGNEFCSQECSEYEDLE